MLSIQVAQRSSVWQRSAAVVYQQLQQQLALQSTAAVTAAAAAAAKVDAVNVKMKSYVNALNSEWELAKPYKQLPGLSKYELLRGFMKGGEFYDVSVNDFMLRCRARFGDIYRQPGMFGQPDNVLLFNVDDFEKVFRTEGAYPGRPGGDAMIHYRLSRKDGFYNENLGLASNGEDWGRFRHIVNPVLMQPKNAKLYLEPMQKVNTDFIERIRSVRDPQTLEVPSNFISDINHLAFESVTVVALDKYFGLVRGSEEFVEAKELFQSLQVFMKCMYDLGIKPSLYKYVPTPTYRRFKHAMDTTFDISWKYINEALQRVESQRAQGDTRERSVLEKLLTIDKKIAMIMAMDMLIAGVDAASTVTTAILLCIARNPLKQQKLREEILRVLPNRTDDFTIENMKHLPYLRACIKEAMRMYPVIFGNMRETGADLALNGYRIPKGTRVMLNSNLLLSEERFFPRAKEFIPERWLRTGAKGNISVEGDKLVAENLNKFIYLPFGFGPRSCVGKRIVDMTLEMALGKVVRNFNVEYNYPAEQPFTNYFLNSPRIPLTFKFTDYNG